MKKYKAVIVEDEVLAAQELNWLLSNYDFLEIIAVFNEPTLALKAIHELQPDLIFLDIQMPQLNGFEFLEKLPVVPEIVFVTAYDEFALKAFELNALDYLLKPVNTSRLESTLKRIKQKWEQKSNGIQNKKLFIRNGTELMFLAVNEIEWAESVGNYVRIHFEKGSSLLHRTLQSFEEISSESEFFRNNKSEIFNMKCIDKIQYATPKISVQLKSGKTIEFSNRQLAKFKQILEQNISIN